MLEKFLSSIKSPSRLALLTFPSKSGVATLQKLWSKNHHVFPILPYRIPDLTHLLVEGRSEGLLVDKQLLHDMKESVKIGSSLGIPVIPFATSESACNESVVVPTESLEVTVEGKWSGSSVPLAVSLGSDSIQSQIRLNVEILKQFRSNPILSLSRNWWLDSLSVENCVYLDDAADSTGRGAEVVIFDDDSGEYFFHCIESGTIDSTQIKHVVFDAPFDERSPVDFPAVAESLNRVIPNAKSWIRFTVPEIGPISHLVPLTASPLGSLSESLSPISGQTVVVGQDGIVSVSLSPGGSEALSYIGRPNTSKAAFGSGIFDTSIPTSRKEEIVEKKPTTGRRKVMKADWRVRQVPIVVYHKKRGFKGQIYYTTKHKGWSFYKSRYHK